MASYEFLLPFQYFGYAWLLLVLCLVFWLVIVTFDLANEDCETSLAGAFSNASASPEPEYCSYFPITFTVTILSTNTHGLHAINFALSLVAKLYRCREASSTTGIKSAESKQICDARAQEVWETLCEYTDLVGGHSSPNGFKEFLINRANAVGLSHVADHIAETLYEEKVAQIVAADHAQLVGQLLATKATGHMAQYPVHLLPTKTQRLESLAESLSPTRRPGTVFRSDLEA